MLDIIKQGGIVMVPLVIGSILTVAVILERLVRLLSCERGGPAFRARVLEAARGGSRDFLTGLQGPVAAVSQAALANWERGTSAVEASMANAARVSMPPLERNLAVLETAVTASPLIGLLGTITGMMGVFRVVAQRLAHDPGADTSHITAGIGEALVATAFGILIAVVAVIAYNGFRSWIDQLQDEAELLATELLTQRP